MDALERITNYFDSLDYVPLDPSSGLSQEYWFRYPTLLPSSHYALSRDISSPVDSGEHPPCGELVLPLEDTLCGVSDEFVSHLEFV